MSCLLTLARSYTPHPKIWRENLNWSNCAYRFPSFKSFTLVHLPFLVYFLAGQIFLSTFQLPSLSLKHHCLIVFEWKFTKYLDAIVIDQSFLMTFLMTHEFLKRIFGVLQYPKFCGSVQINSFFVCTLVYRISAMYGISVLFGKFHKILGYSRQF